MEIVLGEPVSQPERGVSSSSRVGWWEIWEWF